MSGHYRFRNRWTIDAVPGTVVDVLADVARYPTWWRDVRSAHPVDDDTVEVVCRSVLPYALTVRVTRIEVDTVGGRLRAGLRGDLDGELVAVVNAGVGRTQVDITQRVIVRKRLLRVFSPVARPLLRANHALMMWRGVRGLRVHVESQPLT
jgi:hypothetical protein